MLLRTAVLKDGTRSRPDSQFGATSVAQSHIHSRLDDARADESSHAPNGALEQRYFDCAFTVSRLPAYM